MRHSLLCACLVVLNIAGCASGDSPTPAQPAPSEVDEEKAEPSTPEAMPDPDPDPDPDLDEPDSMPDPVAAGGAPAEPDPVRRPGHGFFGTLTTEGGEVVGRTTVLGCTLTTCYFEETDASGNFEFLIEPPVEVAFKTHEDLAAAPRRAAALYPVRLVDDFMVDLGNVHVPELRDGARFGPVEDDPQTLAAGDGLSLTLSRSSLAPKLGETLVDLAARKIPAGQEPRLPELDAAQLVAVYALHPFGAHSEEPIAVTVESTLPAGTRVSFQTISELDGTLSPKVPGRTDGTTAATDAGVGIDELTWLVVSLEE